ncbi:MAG: preprotein translocase subunit SecG [Acidobacteriota bacterium]|nr:preprotein translocase subunit SecG [Acidobacteriota bacterium]MDH3784772.1 preprotein translocase subunit SecG [Acidobacteriota bacterium]
MVFQIILTVFHVVVGLILIGVVLLQTGKRADLAGAFGGGGSQTAFGTRGAATVLSKLTTLAAVSFMVTSIGLSILSNNSAQPSSVLDQVGDAAQQSAPLTPAGGGDATGGLPALPDPIADPTADPADGDEPTGDDSTSNDP